MSVLWELSGGINMSRVIKTVSLDHETDLLASKKPNFSSWVREQLRKDALAMTQTHATIAIFHDKGICNPNASPRCGLCFPFGRPDRSDIRNYNLGNMTALELQNRTKNLYADTLQVQMTKIEEKDALPPIVRERKYLRRILRAIWAFI